MTPRKPPMSTVRRHCRRWSKAEDAILRERYGKGDPKLLALDLRRTVPAVWQRAFVLKLPGCNYRTPSREQYRALLREECLASGVSYPLALSKSREPDVVRARRRVYELLRGDGYSLPGIGSAANRDGSTISYALQVLAKVPQAPSYEARA